MDRIYGINIALTWPKTLLLNCAKIQTLSWETSQEHFNKDKIVTIVYLYIGLIESHSERNVVDSKNVYRKLLDGCNQQASVNLNKKQKKTT